MNNNGQGPLLDLNYNVEYQVEILGYKTGINKFGPWHFYQLVYNGEKFGHFAQPNLHQELSSFNQGDVVTIQKLQTSRRDGFDWVVTSENDQPDSPKTPTPVAAKQQQSPVFDDRTHDIHR